MSVTRQANRIGTRPAVADAWQVAKPEPTIILHDLADGRSVPVVLGGLVEFALLELGGRLVDVIDEAPPAASPGLN